MQILKPFSRIIYTIIKWYYSKTKNIHKRGINFKLQPTVFHPTFYLSTDILLDHLLTHELNNKSILELGCGSGFISMYLAKNTNSDIYASDINPNAVQGLMDNVDALDLKIKIYQSDLFDEIPNLEFDYILINPPYFKKEIETIDEYAFYAGKDLEYFSKLFEQITAYNNSTILVILSENVALEPIQKLASKSSLNFKEVYTKEKNGELFLIYHLQES